MFSFRVTNLNYNLFRNTAIQKCFIIYQNTVLCMAFNCHSQINIIVVIIIAMMLIMIRIIVMMIIIVMITVMMLSSSIETMGAGLQVSLPASQHIKLLYFKVYIIITYLFFSHFCSRLHIYICHIVVNNFLPFPESILNCS